MKVCRSRVRDVLEYILGMRPAVLSASASRRSNEGGRPPCGPLRSACSELSSLHIPSIGRAGRLALRDETGLLKYQDGFARNQPLASNNDAG